MSSKLGIADSVRATAAIQSRRRSKNRPTALLPPVLEGSSGARHRLGKSSEYADETDGVDHLLTSLYTSHMKAIGIYDARAQLGELVRRAATGERIIIEVRGRPMAQLAPVEMPGEDADDAVEWFVARSKERKPWKVTPRELILEGRRE
jgi:prevent-host-death family protein